MGLDSIDGLRVDDSGNVTYLSFDGDTPLDVTKLPNLTNIYANNVTSIQGIEHLTDLDKLRANSVTTLDITALTKLTTLSLDSLVTLDVSHLTGLTYLSADGATTLTGL